MACSCMYVVAMGRKAADTGVFLKSITWLPLLPGGTEAKAANPNG